MFRVKLGNLSDFVKSITAIRRDIINLAPAMRSYAAIQSRSLRAGYLPSGPIIKHWGLGFTDIDAESLLKVYANQFFHKDNVDGGFMFAQLERVLSACNHTASLRAIFPEIERIARDSVYKEGDAKNITSLPSLRHGAFSLFENASIGNLHVLWGKLDIFAPVVISSFDYAYAQDNAPPLGRQPLYRVFRNVPCRHRVCHGYYDDFNERHVINALTILYMVTRLGDLLTETNQRVPHHLHNSRESLKEANENKRMISNVSATLFGLGKIPPKILLDQLPASSPNS